ncbi:MAG: CapA family protein [Methanobacteriaceae archaeon]|jgi:poly-gamma-glutamate synthesis protein (capsule biosynthesis protein)|nr:CapA family protein [Methanobacteriaceae archaeon]
MKKNSIFLILICILIVLSLVASGATFLLGNQIQSSLEPKGNVSISVTGDVMFGRKMPGVLSSNESPYRYVSNVTNNSDILLVNFENPATNSGTAFKSDVPLKCSPTYVPLVKGANTTVCAMANNHAFDYGEVGMNDTINNLNQVGAIHIGAGLNVGNASAPAVIHSNGRTITILNYMDSNNFAEYGQDVMPKATVNSAGYSAYNETLAAQEIQAAKDNGSDYVIVYMHYGNEYSRSPNEAQKNISHQCIDNGADIVIGSHTHVTQGVEMYKGKPIFYNLGNFIFDQSNSATHRAYFLNIQLVNDTAEVTMYPINLVGYLPQFMSPEDGTELLEELNPQCSDVIITPQGTGKLVYNLTRK